MLQRYSTEWLKDRIDSGEITKFIFFWGHTAKLNDGIGKFCFSQWYESSFTVDNITYKTAEHWMMAQKALLFNDKQMFQKIIDCVKPAEAKELGRAIHNFNEDFWNEKRYEIVKEGNIHKFSQNNNLKDFLLKTGNRVLVEASPLDTIWGIGLAADDERINDLNNWPGLNLLGFALMEVRDFLGINKTK